MEMWLANSDVDLWLANSDVDLWLANSDVDLNEWRCGLLIVMLI
jgi:hypothetical protein